MVAHDRTANHTDCMESSHEILKQPDVRTQIICSLSAEPCMQHRMKRFLTEGFSLQLSVDEHLQLIRVQQAGILIVAFELGISQLQ